MRWTRDTSAALQVDTSASWQRYSFTVTPEQTRKRIRVLIAVTDAAQRSQFVGLFGGSPRLEIVGETDTAEGLVRHCQSSMPDMVLLDTKIDSTQLHAALSEKPRTEAGANPLSSREIAILEMIGQGWTNNEIARQIHVSTQTVKADLREAMHKLSARDRCHAVVEALRQGLI